MTRCDAYADLPETPKRGFADIAEDRAVRLQFGGSSFVKHSET
jgi:hypothetical protein